MFYLYLPTCIIFFIKQISFILSIKGIKMLYLFFISNCNYELAQVNVTLTYYIISGTNSYIMFVIKMLFM